MHPLLIFRDERLLDRALTHRSYVNENPNRELDNERLEFLGDALLTFLCGEYLYKHPRYPEMGEDEMTRRRAALVDENQLAKFALDVGLDSRMRLGRGVILEGGYRNKNLLSSTFEAVVGAYYLDRGSDINALRNCILPLFESVFKNRIESRSQVDSKNRFQEWVQAQGITIPPLYNTVKSGGPDHAPEFLARVYVGQRQYGEGKGRNKKEAEKQAAEDALSRLKN